MPRVEAVRFDYEAKQWGGTEVQPRPWYLQGLKLRYCLEDLATVRGSCLDVGCGAGNMAKALKRERPYLHVYGVDVSRAAIETARRDREGVRFDLFEGDRLPYRDAQFEAVTMFDVLEHVEQPDRLLAEIGRVLKPGGLFHIAVPLEGQPGTIYHYLSARGWDAKRRHVGHIQAFDQDGFRRMAGMAGLPVRRVRWSFHPLFALIDVAYYRWLDFRGPVGHSVEDLLAQRPGPAATLLKGFKALVASLGWAESRLLRRFPGACGHFTCIRSQ